MIDNGNLKCDCRFDRLFTRDQGVRSAKWVFDEKRIYCICTECQGVLQFYQRLDNGVLI